jgi:hypothetical protein
MLFLRHIQEIEWSTPDGQTGCYVRQETPSGAGRRRVSVIGETEDRADEETWLIFEAPFANNRSSVPLRVEAAFNLAREKDNDRESVAPVNGAMLSVYFPTEKPTGLGFLIQGPYRTTPARDNVPPEDPDNQRLVAATAKLVVSALGQLKELNLLTVRALQTLPLRQSDFMTGSMFRPIFEAVAEALKTEPLIPTDDGGFVSATQARISRGAELRRLFPAETLTALQGAASQLRWVSAEITQDRTADLYAFFRQILQIEEVDPASVVRQLGRPFLEGMSDEWLAQFYEFLLTQEALWREPRKTWETPGPARSVPIIRLEDGTHVVPFRKDGSAAAYLTAPFERGDTPLVRQIFVKNEQTRAFLEKLGIGEFDVIATVREKIVPKYQAGRAPVPAAEHLEDIRFIAQSLSGDAAAKRSGLLSLARNSPCVRARNAVTGEESYRKPGEVYYSSDELRMYFEGNTSAWFLSDLYPEELGDSLEALGVARTIRIQQPDRTTDWQGNTILANDRGSHERGLEGFDPDFDVDGLKYAVSHPTLQRSVYIWEKIARPHNRQIRGVIEKSSYKDFRNAERSDSWSKMGEYLSGFAWLPRSGRFVKPAAISLDDLPQEFDRDEALAARLQLKVDEVATLARKVGVDVEVFTLAKQIAEDPELYAQVCQLRDAKAQKPEFPVRSTPDPGRRATKAAVDAEAAPPKTYEDRRRSVRTSEPAQEPTTWLREAYTNSAGQMVCQICEEEMPFRKRDGQHYFEAVEALNTLPAEHHALFLALCPVCAAKYKEFVKRDEGEDKRVRGTIASAKEPVIPLTLGSENATLRFVDSHFIDLQAVLQAAAGG